MELNSKVKLNKQIVMQKLLAGYEDDFIYYSDVIAGLLLGGETTGTIIDIEKSAGIEYYGVSFDEEITAGTTVDFWFMTNDLEIVK